MKEGSKRGNPQQMSNRTVTNIPFSSYAQFAMTLKGLRFETKKGTKLDKWEVFHQGYTPEQILTKQVPFIVYDEFD